MNDPWTPEGGISEKTLEDIRLAVYTSLAETGQLPRDDQLAALTGSADKAAEAVGLLADRRAWALGSDGDIALAHPFATRSFGYSVMSHRTLWWGGCCWDAFAIPHLVPNCGPVIIAGECPGCGTPLVWRVDASTPPEGPERAHFLTPMSHVWDDVIFTCSNQRLFCNDRCIDEWLDRTGHEEGYRMGLATLWRFASGWYEGRLERGYQRREPAEALSYFRDVGLTGSFWGLPD